MQYMLLICSKEDDEQKWTPAQNQEIMGAYMAYTQALQQAGVLRHAERLRPTGTATTVRVASGKTEVLNGPYAETREQLGGYYMIDVPDLDTAIQWAARCPGASHGKVEVRPVWDMSQG